MRDIICERRIFNCKTHCEDAEIFLFTDGIFTLDLKAFINSANLLHQVCYREVHDIEFFLVNPAHF